MRWTVTSAQGLGRVHATYTTSPNLAVLPAFAGLATGLAASLLAARVVQKLLYGVKAVDPSVILIVAVLFLAAHTLPPHSCPRTVPPPLIPSMPYVLNSSAVRANPAFHAKTLGDTT